MNEVSDPIPFHLETPDSTLNGRVDLPILPGERPAVVICHGVEGSLDWGFLPYLATLLAARGFVAIRVETRELAGLLAVLEALFEANETIAPGRVDRRRLGLFGHGRGGGTALLAGARAPWNDRVRTLVTWAAAADPGAVAAVRAPWLIVHGAEDETVPVEEGRRLAALAGGEHELRVIPDASHSFGVRHPFTGPTPQLIQALNATQRWFRAHL